MLFYFLLCSLCLLVKSQHRVKRQEIIFGEPPSLKSDCQTPDNLAGNCISLFTCDDLYSKLRGGSRTPEFIAFLRESICRYQNRIPIVCCPIEVDTSPDPLTITIGPSEEEIRTTEEVITTPETPAETTPPKVGFALLPETCGNVTTASVRIVGGRIADPGSWPWLAALGYRSRGKLDFLCGGSLITDRHILTAAHCIHGRRDLEVIRLGEHDLDRETESEHEDFKIVKRIEHPNYDTSSFVNDIAILVLDRKVEFKKHIKPVCLPLHEKYINNSLVGLQGLIAGWGSIAYNNISSPILKEAMIPIVDNDGCQEKYAVFRSVVIDETRLCAGVGGDDACQGDSGGPLNTFNNQMSSFDIVGVVSVGFRCAEPEFPGIYTRVTEYIDWIEDNLEIPQTP